MGLLRIALALAVLLSHLPSASYKFLGGGLAVQGFFIVSGFYMALVLEGKYRDISLFYTNRTLRLFPTYLVMMAVGAFALFVLNASATSTQPIFARAYGHPGPAVFFAFENLALVGQDLLYWFRIAPDGALAFDPSGAPPTDDSPVAWQALLVPQSWSLSLELMFYVLAPWLVRLPWRWVALIAAASIALRLAGHALPVDYGLWQGRFFPTVLFLFLLGVLAQKALPLAARLSKWIGWAANVALLAWVATMPLLHIEAENSRWLTYAFIAIAAPFIFNAARDHAIDRWIGDLSYPLYLCHLVVVGLVLTFNPPLPAWTAIGGSLAASILLLVLIDRPVDRWRQIRARSAGKQPLRPAQPQPHAAAP